MSAKATRIPVAATVVVALAVAAMIALGVWQLRRRDEKAALLARYAVNATRPPVALAALLPLRDADLFRRAGADCLQPTRWETQAGRTVDDRPGWRQVAMCRTGAEGPGFAADMGVSTSDKPPAWTGGSVRGRVTYAPSDTSLLGRLLGHAPPQIPMIVAETPAPGLAASRPPDLANIPNNHLAYAVQWFLFAGVASAIYVLLLVRRARSVAPGPPGR